MFLFLACFAHAADLDLGVGLRSTPSPFYSGHYGVRPFGRLLLSGHFGVEAGAYVRLPGDGLSNLTQTLVGISYAGDSNTTFRQPIDREAASVELLAVLSPWKRPHEDGVTLWGAGTVGIAGMMYTHSYATVNPEYASGSDLDNPAAVSATGPATVNLGPALGLTFEMSIADRIGVRLLGLQRYYLAEEPDYGNTLSNGEPVELNKRLYPSTAVELDVMVNL